MRIDGWDSEWSMSLFLSLSVNVDVYFQHIESAESRNRATGNMTASVFKFLNIDNMRRIRCSWSEWLLTEKIFFCGFSMSCLVAKICYETLVKPRVITTKMNVWCIQTFGLYCIYNSKSFANEFYESNEQFKIYSIFRIELCVCVWHYNKRDKVVNKLFAISHAIKFKHL